MRPRTSPAVCLGTRGNMQGSTCFLDLETEKVIKCRAHAKLPMPDSVIKQVKRMADEDKMPEGWECSNRCMQPFDFQVDDTQRMAEPAEPTYRDMPAKFPGVQRTACTSILTEPSDQISDDKAAMVEA